MPTLLRWPAHDWARTTYITAEDQAAIALLGPEAHVELFTEAIISWAANTPAESWIEVEARVRHDDHWSRFYQIARWDDKLETSKRTSFDSQRDADARVAVDTLVANSPCDAIQIRVVLFGPAELRSVTAALSGKPASESHNPQPTSNIPHATPQLTIPLRSQMVYPNGGNVWCSPTCITMMLAYWHEQTGDPRLAPYVAHEAVPDRSARFCYDPAYNGTGNWIFNTAFAASLGLEAYVARFEHLTDLVPWLERGIPIVVSVAWNEGELYGAAIAKSNGHLLIVTGLEREHVITADPAGRDASEVRRVYRSSELERTWIGNSQGTVYLIYPQNWIE